MTGVADFRSDTVTRPTAAMRQAMAEAVVGDDVFQDDPTVRALEEDVAARFGRAAALFVPSGSQGNQIAAHLHTRPGQEAVVGDTSHTLDWELAGLAALSGLQARPVPSWRGVLDLDAVRNTLRDAGGFRPACKLLTVENTHNFHGGAVVPLEHLQALRGIATEKGARVHLDGARLWNAAVASGTPLEAYGAVADSIMACFSKGLGAPIGSILIGDADFITEAREVRKLFGGGMRQVGVIAAPAHLALDGYEARLAADHDRARRLADGFTANAGVSLLYEPVETNIVFVRAEGRDAAAIEAALAADHVLAIATGPDVLRFVTHCDVDDAHVERALQSFAKAVE
ncbi:MAG: GntG family PLP-dependent aldolase [Planctomycetota bacterium]|nr:GntG family PLP-dependent aldolase [Planctomycetota bacterium]